MWTWRFHPCSELTEMFLAPWCHQNCSSTRTASPTSTRGVLGEDQEYTWRCLADRIRSLMAAVPLVDLEYGLKDIKEDQFWSFVGVWIYGPFHLMKIFPEADLGVNYGTARKMSSIQEWFGRILCQGMFWRGEYMHSIVEEQLSFFNWCNFRRYERGSKISCLAAINTGVWYHTLQNQ